MLMSLPTRSILQAACLLVITLLTHTSDAGPCLEPNGVPLPIWGGPSTNTPGCAPGFYCPNLNPTNSSTWPVICPPTMPCALKRLAADWCPPQGTYEPTVCPEGHYCPPPGNSKFRCPSGFYCPLGSFQPLKCPWLSLCPEGSSKYRQIGVIMLLLLVDMFLGFLVIAYFLYRKYKHTNYFKELHEDTPDDVEGAPEYNSTRVLIEGFHMSRGNQPLLDFDFNELGLSIPGGKKVLQGVTGSVRHGQVTAVMGPSGAGKTTFINTLMGKVDSNWKTEGSLRVNGVEAKGLAKLKKLIGYVPQEDVMHRELSVWQNLKYSADIRLPRSWSNKERERHVRAVLDVLDLTSVRNTEIGDEMSRGVSGGQRKRVNIGMELAACPLALFCDEPTSGLDSSASLAVVTAVKKVARSTGMTVVMVIHQPRVEIWNSLDRVLILAPGGITAYLGEQRFAQHYFAHFFNLEFKMGDNPADMIMDYLANHGAECARVWRQDGGKEWLVEFASRHKPAEPEFDDHLAESITQSLTQSKQLKSSGSVPKAVERDVEDGSEFHFAASSMTTSVMMEEVGDSENGRTSPPIISTSNNRIERSSNNNGSNSSNKKPKSRPLQESNGTIIMDEAPNANDHVVRGANFFAQLWYALLRSLKQQYMTIGSFILEMGLATLAGAIIGFSAEMHYAGVAVAPYTTLSPAPERTIVPQKALYTAMAVGIAAASAGVKTFGEGMVVFWRESSAGHNRVAYFCAQSLAMLPRIFLGGLHFSTLYKVLSRTYTPFDQLYINVSLLFFAVYGLTSIVSMLVPRKDAPLLAAVICVIAAVLNGYVRAIPVQLDYLSYAYWSHDAIFTGETKVFAHVYNLTVSEDFFRLRRNRLSLDFGMIFVIGTVYRIIAFGCLLFMNRDKQR